MTQSYESGNANVGREDDDEFDGYFEDLDNDIMPNNDNGQRAVSYTHLDVYKRQAIHRPTLGDFR